MDWIANDVRSKGRIGRAVVSMSLGADRRAGDTGFLDEATAALADIGVFVTVSSGNANVDTDLFTPARVPQVCTVGATDRNDRRGDFSNFGPLVDVLAPGVDVTSAWIGLTTATNTITGTSMACPHVAGVGAYLLGMEGSRNGAQLCSRIQELSTKDVISNLKGEQNRLLYNGV